MKILLFDMDGVLVEPQAYHRAFQETVALVGRLLGYRAVDLTPQDIAAFEAAGVASEWDSSAICAALLLEQLWAEHPMLRLPVALASPLLPAHDHPAPDFQAFARSLAQPRLAGTPPLQRAERLLLPGRDSRTTAQRQTLQTLQAILRDARQAEGSLTHRIFQELVLGSQVFTQTYSLPPSLATESYLLRYDRGTLSDQERAGLLGWLRDDDHRAAIFTNRPSRPVGGNFSTPEAEMGAQGIGLETLPIAGLGGLPWLSSRRGRDPEAFLKPSPVHALAALRLALGDPLEAALEAAAALALDGQADDTWGVLAAARVYVFEDTVAGLNSARTAQELLARCGVPLHIHLFGVTASPSKAQALGKAAATVTPTLALALEYVPGLALYRVSRPRNS